MKTVYKIIHKKLLLEDLTISLLKFSYVMI